LAPRKRTWGVALDRFQVEDGKPAGPRKRGPKPGRRRHRITRRTRYLRPNRPYRRYYKREPPPGWVELWLHATVPEQLKLRIYQLARYDDRTLSELVILGLTWVVTEWAAKRIPPGAETAQSIQAFREYYVNLKGRGAYPRRLYIKKETVQKLQYEATTKKVAGDDGGC
jgi:hypothetical protein